MIRGPRCKKVATQVDHIIPVADGGPLYDEDNLRACCAPCNSWRAQRQKSQAGWRRSNTHIILVLGPVGSGKSTYVKEHASPEDVIVDYDDISQAIGLPLSRGNSHEGRHKLVSKLRNTLIRAIKRGEVDAPRAWIVSANPNAERIYPHHEVITVDPGREAVLNQHTDSRPVSMVPLVDEWYARREQSTVRADW